MPKAPRITGEQAVKAFVEAGFIVDRMRGSHCILQHPNKAERLSIPVHKGKTVGIGLLARQVEVAGLTIEEFVRLLSLL